MRPVGPFDLLAFSFSLCGLKTHTPYVCNMSNNRFLRVSECSGEFEGAFEAYRQARRRGGSNTLLVVRLLVRSTLYVHKCAVRPSSNRYTRVCGQTK